MMEPFGKRLRVVLVGFAATLGAWASDKTFNNFNALPCYVTIVAASGKCFTASLKAGEKAVRIPCGAEVPNLILIVWVDPEGYKAQAFTAATVKNLVSAPVGNLAGHSLFMADH